MRKALATLTDVLNGTLVVNVGSSKDLATTDATSTTTAAGMNMVKMGDQATMISGATMEEVLAATTEDGPTAKMGGSVMDATTVPIVNLTLFYSFSTITGRILCGLYNKC
jgi:hypothetical protein